MVELQRNWTFLAFYFFSFHLLFLFLEEIVPHFERNPVGEGNRYYRIIIIKRISNSQRILEIFIIRKRYE